MKELSLRYDSLEAFTADYESNLSKGRAFVTGAEGLAERDRCTLEIERPGSAAKLKLLADAVWIGPTGVGLAFVDFDAAKKRKLDDFAKPPAPARNEPAPAAGEDRNTVPRNLHERMRALSIGQREDMARHGSLTERVALERAYGGVVWEGLLQNPGISTSEIARISRNGTLPKPLVRVIVSNPGWVSSPEVQRALMSNPRCSGPDLERVIRSIDPHELKRLTQHCPYRAEVRSLVRQLAPRAR